MDTLSVAVQLYTRVRIVDLMPSKPDVIETTFLDGPFSGENRIETAFRYARKHFGVATPGVRIETSSEIPRRAGLGSSAAAAVAGLQLYAALTTSRQPLDWLPLASAIEGHPDNAAASLLGGMTASCQYEDGTVTALAWPWPEEIRLVVATPDVPLDTSHARSVLPSALPYKDAVFNLQRAVLLVRALQANRHDLIKEAVRDRWHQPFRAPLVPGLAEALALDHPGLLGVFLSGAGPSIMALVGSHDADVAALLSAIYDRLDVSHTIRRLQVHQPSQAGQPAKSGAS
jgi:homoserine kinase